MQELDEREPSRRASVSAWTRDAEERRRIGARALDGRVPRRTPRVYVISVAAELAGVHPQTLRIYERKGLLQPKRTPGNSRRYSAARHRAPPHDPAAHAATGVNLAGVKLFMEMQAALESMRRRAEELEARAVARRVRVHRTGARAARRSSRSARARVPVGVRAGAPMTTLQGTVFRSRPFREDDRAGAGEDRLLGPEERAGGDQARTHGGSGSPRSGDPQPSGSCCSRSRATAAWSARSKRGTSATRCRRVSTSSASSSGLRSTAARLGRPRSRRCRAPVRRGRRPAACRIHRLDNAGDASDASDRVSCSRASCAASCRARRPARLRDVRHDPSTIGRR